MILSIEHCKIVPEEHRPKSFLIEKNSTVSVDGILLEMKENNIQFPIILKPDIGYRGLLVHKIDDVEELGEVLKKVKITVDQIVQEFIAFPVEIGVFYYRMPNESKGTIPSLTIKEFLKVKGDGRHTLAELVNMNPRAILQEEKLKKTFIQDWETVIPNGEEMILEHIGNHNRGYKICECQ